MPWRTSSPGWPAPPSASWNPSILTQKFVEEFPFALSVSKGDISRHSCFDKFSTSGATVLHISGTGLELRQEHRKGDTLVVEHCGRNVNPIMVEGQVHGAVAQGISNALYEDLPYDAQAHPLAATFMDYLLPTAPGFPAMEVLHIAKLPLATLGRFKEMFEDATTGATASVAIALAPLRVKATELQLVRAHRQPCSRCSHNKVINVPTSLSTLSTSLVC